MTTLIICPLNQKLRTELVYVTLVELMALTKRKKTNEMKKTRLHEGDTGSPEAQIAVLTRRINELTSHLKKHPKDKHSRRGLIGLVEKRRTQIKYLQEKSKKRYNKLAKELDLKQLE